MTNLTVQNKVKTGKGFASVLTASGRSAVAVVGIALAHTDGDAKHARVLEEVLDVLFTPIGTKPFSHLSGQSIVYGVWNDSQEDLVLVRRQNGVIEVHCHGGKVAVEAVLKGLTAQGFQVVSSADFLLHGNRRWAIETQLMLSRAETSHTAKWLLNVASIQDQALGELRGQINDLTAGGDVDAVVARLQTSLGWFSFGLGLTTPRSVVLFGKPNVGKSSLINRMVGFQRVIVNEQAGTTRDVVSQKTAFEGWPVELKDTAGLRETKNKIESMGVGKAKDEIEKADLRVVVLDHAELSASQGQLNVDDLRLLEQTDPDLVVFNKSDLNGQPCQGFELSCSAGCISVSAETGQNIELLMKTAAACLVPEVPHRETWFPVSLWQAETLRSVISLVRSGSYDSAIELLSQ